MDHIQLEFELIDQIEHPHLSFTDNAKAKKNIAYQILNNYLANEIIIIDPYGFSIDSVFAGLTEAHIEYIAKNAPSDYKKAISSILKDEEAMKNINEIVKDMDNDKGGNLNQTRINNVIQYIKDNKIVFEF